MLEWKRSSPPRNLPFQNGAPCTFTVYCEDNGEPGRTDEFTIEVSGEPAEGGTLDQGNIQIHES